MASVHIREIQEWLHSRGESDALPGGPDGMFLEILFEVPDAKERTSANDAEFANRVLTSFSPQGTVTISFDESGDLRALDIS